MKNFKNNIDKNIIIIIILAILLLAFIVATIVLASLKSKTDCDQCLACATNSDQTQVCCHIENGSPIYTDAGKYTCGLTNLNLQTK
jgi:hypothetical protein